MVQSENTSLLDNIDRMTSEIDQYQQVIVGMNNPQNEDADLNKKVSEFALSEALRIKRENEKEIQSLIAELDRLRSEKKSITPIGNNVVNKKRVNIACR